MNPASTVTAAASLAAAFSLCLCGCATNRVAHVGEGPREQIAYAATAQYPGSATPARPASAQPAARAADAAPAADPADPAAAQIDVRQTGQGTVVQVRPLDDGDATAAAQAADARLPATPAPAADARDTARPAPAAAATPTAAYRLAAIDHRDRKELELINLSDTSVPASTIWVNGAFVHRVQSIPPRGSARVRYSELLEAGRPTADLRALDQHARKVELQVGDTLHSVQGPAVK